MAARPDPLQQRWLALTRHELPARARAQRWGLRLDHCFQRVLLDAACGGRWYDHVVGRPAYRHLGRERLQVAVALGERLAREPGAARLLADLDAQSLAWRGRRGRTGRPQRSGDGDGDGGQAAGAGTMGGRSA